MNPNGARHFTAATGRAMLLLATLLSPMACSVAPTGINKI
jgi:hypothetical protein